jgi:adenylate cyclase
VLPLRNLSDDPTQEYFSDGMSEAFISELSKVEGLKVISRSSVFTFKDREISPLEVGQTLGVEAMLEGSMRKNGDTIIRDLVQNLSDNAPDKQCESFLSSNTKS